MLNASSKTTYGYAVVIGLSADDVQKISDDLSLTIHLRDVGVTINGLHDHKIVMHQPDQKRWRPEIDSRAKLFFIPVRLREAAEMAANGAFSLRYDFVYRKKTVVKVMVFRCSSEKKLIKMLDGSDLFTDEELRLSGFIADSKTAKELAWIQSHG